jgi:hypothetical protein
MRSSGQRIRDQIAELIAGADHHASDDLVIGRP